MDNYSGNKEYNIYRDIRNRTNGGDLPRDRRSGAHWKIHLHQTVYGVDGTSFMEGEAEKERAMDELPQAAPENHYDDGTKIHSTAGGGDPAL